MVDEHVKKNKLKSKNGIIIEMLAVSVSRDFTGKGIAGHLTRILKETGIKLGYKFLYAECTGEFSKKAIMKQGGEVKLSIPYKEHEYRSGCCSKPTYPFAEA